jgi:hypothetical protein
MMDVDSDPPVAEEVAQLRADVARLQQKVRDCGTTILARDKMIDCGAVARHVHDKRAQQLTPEESTRRLAERLADMLLPVALRFKQRPWEFFSAAMVAYTGRK